MNNIILSFFAIFTVITTTCIIIAFDVWLCVALADMFDGSVACRANGNLRTAVGTTITLGALALFSAEILGMLMLMGYFEKVLTSVS